MVVAFKPNFSAAQAQPPFDAELEEKILGGALLDNNALALIIDIIPSPDAFYILDHQRIYRAALELHQQGDPVDLMTVTMWLHASGQLEAIGGQTKLVNLVDPIVSTVNIDHYALRLVELFKRRQVIEAASETLELATDPQATLSEVSDKVKEQLNRLGNPSPSTIARITQLIESNPLPSELFEAFAKLAKETGRLPKDIKQLYETLEADWENEDSRIERKQEIEQLESCKERTLTLSKYLPESYAKPMTQIAQWMEAPTAAFMTIKLAAVASCLHPQTRIVVKKSIGFVEPAIVYAGIVTESGQRKSPILNAVLDGLKELQAEEEERFRTEQQEYLKQHRQWEHSKPRNKEELPAWLDNKPVEPQPVREFYVDKATIEAIDKIKGQQKDSSFILIKDELSGLFSSYGAYKNGRGEDKQSILSGWNGRGVKKNLKGGERVSLAHDSMSIVGAIQDAALQKQMGNFDDDLGEWARFLWALIPLKAMRLPESDTTFQLTYLKDLYARARDLKPQEYKFAFDAQALYDNYHWKLEQRRVSHPQRGMRAAISKMEGYTARLALILHLIWELEAGKTEPTVHIPRSRVQAAIALSEFYLSQVTLIHSQGAAALGEGGLGKRLSAILDKLKQFGELTAGKLQSAISWLRKERPSSLRQDLVELSKLGYGRLVGKGNRLKLVWNNTTPDTPEPTTDQTTDRSLEAEMIAIREIETLTTDTTDTTDTPLSFLENETRTPVNTPASGLSDEAVTTSTCELGEGEQETELLTNYQEYQDISSFSQSPEKSTSVATDEVSVDLSVVDESVSVDNDPPPTGGGKVPSSPSPTPRGSGKGFGNSCQFPSPLPNPPIHPAPSKSQKAALWDEPGAAEDLAGILNKSDSEESLAQVLPTQVFSPEILNRADQHLPLEKREQIKPCSLESNGKSSPHSSTQGKPKVGNRIRWGEFTAVIEGIAASGIYYVRWEVSPSQRKLRSRMGNPIPEQPRTLKDGEFELI